MVQFAESSHNRSMRSYETALGQAKASNQDRRRSYQQQIEDELVEGGAEEIKKYEALMNERWQAASCLTEYDGVNMGFAIIRRAKERLQEAEEGSQ